jgi:beta-lactamase regulating signal transducer with metallopeptidase domain
MTTLQALASQPWAQTLGWTLLHFLWQGAALGLLAWLALTLLRGASARTRYGLACACLLLMVAAPALTYLALRPGFEALAPALAAPSEGLAPAGALPLAQRVKVALDPSLPWLLAGWAAGVLLLSIRFLGSWIRVQRLRRHGATPVPSEWHLVLSRLCRDLKLSRTVRLLQSAAVEVPTALGWLRPVILVPACALTGLAPLQLEAILAHELAHIRRGDFLVNLLQSLVEVLLFYHPAVWWLSARIRTERELCCDDVAAQTCGDPLILARALTDLEALRVPLTPPPAHLALAANGGSLMHRIRHLLHPALPVSNGARAAALAVVAASLLGAAGVALQDKDASPKAEKTTRIKVLDEDRKLDVRMKGDVQLNAEAPDPVVVPGDGSFQVEEKKGGESRSFKATRGKTVYTVNGQEMPFGKEGREWVRGIVTETRKAQADRAKAHVVKLHAEKDRAKADEERVEVEVHRALAEADRARAEAHKALAKEKRIQVEVVEKPGDGHKTFIVRRKGSGGPGGESDTEIITEDLPDGHVILHKKVDGKEMVEKRLKVIRKGGEGKDHLTWNVVGPEGETIDLEGLEQDIDIPEIHILRRGGDPAMEMEVIQAQLKALQARLDQLKKQVAEGPKPTWKPKATHPVPPPPPPPPPPPAPDAPPAPPAPPAAPAPPAPVPGT